MSLSNNFPRIILFLILLSSFFDYGGAIRNISYMLILIYPALIAFVSGQKLLKDKLIPGFIFYTFWCLFLVACHALIFHSFFFHFVGMLVPNIYLIFWYIFSIVNKEKFDYERYLKDLNVFYSIIGILGIIQIHFSKDLFGLITSGEVVLIKDLDFINFRATSLTGSPQVYGLAMVLIAILNLDNFFKNRRKVSLSLAIFFLICAAYSQNKSVGVLFCLYLISSLVLYSNRYRGLKYLALIIFIIILANANSFLETFFRTTSFEQLLASEQVGRISIYTDLLTNTNPIVGQGWGKFDSIVAKIFGVEYQNPESFILLLYGESGIVVLCLFFVFIIGNLIHTSKFFWPLMFIFIAQFFFVHAALSPFIFPFFFIIFIRNMSSIHKLRFH